MDLATELAHFSPAADLLTWIGRRVGDLQSRASQEIRWRDAKIEKLTLELAHLRRIRFGVKSEALGSVPSDLFHETLSADIATCEAHLAEQDAAGEGIRPPAPKAPRRSPGLAGAPATGRASA